MLKVCDFLLFKKNAEFKLLSEIGDLSFYTFHELCDKLENFDHSLVKIDNSLVTIFESKFTFLEIIYCRSGKFVKIKNQYWK